MFFSQGASEEWIGLSQRQAVINLIEKDKDKANIKTGSQNNYWTLNSKLNSKIYFFTLAFL